jgi:xylulokinase
MNRAWLGIDVGTTGVRAAVVTEAGRTVAEAAEPCPADTRVSGRAEADPEAWWVAIRTVLGRIGSRTPLRDIEGIGVVGQAPTAVLVDANARPVRPAILWLDARADTEARAIESRLGPGVAEAIGGNRSHAYFLGPKLAWLRTHEPRALEGAALIVPSHTFIVLRLTGEAACDASTAMLCAPLFDAHAREWSAPGAKAVGVDLAQLPRIAPAHAVVGRVTRQAGALVGLREGTPVVAGGGDFAAAALGSGVIEEGQVGLMLGTAGNLLLPMASPHFDTRLIQSHHVGVERWLALGGTLCGAALEWFRETCASGADWETLESEVARLDDPASDLMVLPYFQGERTPIWNAKARAVIFGADLTHGRAQLYRALLEGIALGFKHAARVAEEGGIRLGEVVATNGAGRSGVLRQILCDALGAPLAWADDAGGTVRGAAALAALGTGLGPDGAARRSWFRRSEGAAPVRHVPQPRSQERLERLFARRLSLYGALESEFARERGEPAAGKSSPVA